MSTARRLLLGSALVLAGSLLPSGAAATLTVVALRLGPAAPAQEEERSKLTSELALRCPTARQQPFEQLRPLLPRFHEAAPRPSRSWPDLQAEFLRTDDWRGTAARLLHHGAELEREPVALLTDGSVRRRLRDAHLFAARALLSAGDEAGARRVLRHSALRLRDLPAATIADWGPALQAADQQARQQLPAPIHALLLHGPPGWALHVDEQPVGALPRPAVPVSEGGHGVVLVAPDGARTSWVVEISATAPPSTLRLRADPRLDTACALHGAVGLCAPREREVAPPPGWEGLAWILNSDLLVLSAGGAGQYLAWRLQPGRPAGPPLQVPQAGAAAHITRALCAQRSAASPTALLEGRPQRLVRSPRWPALLLLGVGAAAVVSAVPLFTLHGRCVAEDCALAYNFNWLAGALAGGGGATALGGGLWFALARR